MGHVYLCVTEICGNIGPSVKSTVFTEMSQHVHSLTWHSLDRTFSLNLCTHTFYTCSRYVFTLVPFVKGTSYSPYCPIMHISLSKKASQLSAV